jgi:hypothetical protein
MKESISNFLQFNNTNVLFTSVDGVTYVAIKPICQALNVDYAGQFKSIKKDPILGSAWYIYTIQVPNSQGRKYTCIPEKYIYGWLFSINSSNPEFIEFKKECYNLLYNHFHGVIGRRKELLLGQAEVAIEIDQLKTKLFASADYKKLLELETRKKIYTKEMNKVDKIVLNQSELKFD